jgi:hypothetical protein
MAVWGVCDRRTESNGESLTWEEFPAGSCSVGGRLMALALICGSHGLGEADIAVSTPVS